MIPTKPKKIIEIIQYSPFNWGVAYTEAGRRYDITMNLSQAEAIADAERRYQLTKYQIWANGPRNQYRLIR